MNVDKKCKFCGKDDVVECHIGSKWRVGCVNCKIKVENHYKIEAIKEWKKLVVEKDN